MREKSYCREKSIAFTSSKQPPDNFIWSLSWAHSGITELRDLNEAENQTRYQEDSKDQ